MLKTQEFSILLLYLNLKLRIITKLFNCSCF